jgi:tripartite-type tricarboxylate transporter receptor subunit TctC
VLGIHAKLPVKNLQELIAYARANPGKLSFASQGNASTGQMTGIMFMQMANIDLKHIPYRGAAPAWNDVVAGHVDMLWDGVPAAIGQIQGGTVRALAVGSRERAQLLPDVPTAIEAGLAGFESESWFATAVAIDTPDPLVKRLSETIARIIHSPEVSTRIVEMGARPIGSTPGELAAYAKATTALWKKVIEKGNIHIE